MNACSRAALQQWAKTSPPSGSGCAFLGRLCGRQGGKLWTRQHGNLQCSHSSTLWFYENKEFVLGFCSCKSTPRCVIGGAVTPGCICEQGNRHTKSDAKLRQKITGHEPSTRHKFHVKFMPGDIDGVIENTDHHAEDVREDAAAVVDAAAAEEVDGEEDEGAGPTKDTRLDF